MDCPNCGTTMRERDRSGVKIDFCPSCKGIWLDRGELDKIIEIELGDDDLDDPNDFGARADYRGHAIEARNAENAREARRDDDRRPSKKRSFFENLTEMLGGE